MPFQSKSIADGCNAIPELGSNRHFERLANTSHYLAILYG